MDTEINTLIADFGTDVAEVKRLIAIYKTGGKPALLGALAAELPLAQKQFADVKAALPTIKAGYKTTEFWLIAAFGLANVIVPIVTGKAIPFDTNTVLAAVLAAYTGIRAATKKA